MTVVKLVYYYHNITAGLIQGVVSDEGDKPLISAIML